MHQGKARYIPKEYRTKSPKPIIVLGITIVSFAIFLYWTFSVVMPVIAVEMTYQFRKTTYTLFGNTPMKSLLLPTIRLGTGPNTRTPNGAVAIPALFLDEPIMYNVDPNDQNAYLAALKKGIAQASATRLPGYGGLGYYFAHSSSPNLARQFNAVFYLLGKLKGGEPIIIWHDGKEYHYTVTKIQETDPTDISFLQAIYDKETIVLQTCWPPGTTLRRLLVFATRDE
jgi:LPXTG-site transpeptidase (sortase) family protein